MSKITNMKVIRVILFSALILFFLNFPLQTFALKVTKFKDSQQSPRFINANSAEKTFDLSNNNMTDPKLTIIINLFDGTRNLIDKNENIHIELKERYGKQEIIQARDAEGPTHKFENVDSKLILNIKSAKYEIVEKLLDDPVDSQTYTQNVNVIMIPKRKEIRPFSWQEISNCCPEIKRIFSSGFISESEARLNYEKFIKIDSNSYANVFSMLNLLSKLGSEDKSLLPNVYSIDFGSKINPNEFTIWADVNAIETWKNYKWRYGFPFQFSQGKPSGWETGAVKEFFYLMWDVEIPQRTKNIEGKNYVAVTIASRPHTIEQYSRMWYWSNSLGYSFNPIYTVTERTVPTYFEAASDGNLDALMTYIANGTLIESEDSNRMTALEIAATNGRENIVTYLLEQGANPNHGFPLVIAAEEGFVNIVDRLINKGAAITQIRYELTPLLAACKSGKIDVVDLLLKKGALKNESNNNRTNLLEFSIASGNVDVLKLLLSNGLDANSINSKNLPILVNAISAKQLTAVEVLLNYKANPNSMNGLPLLTAVNDGNKKAVELLLNNGADVNTAASEIPVLIPASLMGHTEIVELLLNHNANPNRSLQGITPLMAASLAGHVEIVALLISKSADVNIKTSEKGYTALILAAKEGTPETILLLIKAGADSSYKVDGKTALEFANQSGNRQAAVALNNAKTGNFVLQRDFSYSVMGQNPNTLRRELLDSFLFKHSELLNKEAPEKSPLNISDTTKAQIKSELKFMTDALISLYNKNQKQISTNLKVDLLKQLSVAIDITDEGETKAYSVLSEDIKNPGGDIYFDVKYLKAIIGASIGNSYPELKTSPDGDRYLQVADLRRQIRNLYGINLPIKSTGLASIQIPLSNFNNLENVFEQLDSYYTLLNLSQKIKESETQYYGTILFIIAHELGHLALKHQKLINAENECGDLRKKIEIQADQFAALLLGSTYIALSVDFLPVQMQMLGKRNIAMLNKEKLSRYLGYSLYFKGTYERLTSQTKEKEECYPLPDARLQIITSTVNAILKRDGDSIVDKIQRRQDFKDAFFNATFPKRLGLFPNFF